MSVITCKLPATEVSGKAGQRQNYRGASSLSSIVRGVTVTEHDGSSWVFCSPDEGRNVR